MSKGKSVKTVNVVSVKPLGFCAKAKVVVLASFPDDREGRSKAARFFAGAIRRLEKDIDDVEFEECVQDGHYFGEGDDLEIFVCGGRFMA